MLCCNQQFSVGLKWQFSKVWKHSKNLIFLCSFFMKTLLFELPFCKFPTCALLAQPTLSWRRPLSYRIQFIDLLCKSMDWFLYDKDLRHERVKWWLQNLGTCQSSMMELFTKVVKNWKLMKPELVAALTCMVD